MIYLLILIKFDANFKTMSKYFLGLIFIVIFSSCSNSLEFKPKNHKFTTSKNCVSDYDCCKINFKIIETNNRNAISDSVNKHLLQSIKTLIVENNGFDSISNYKSLGNIFIQNFNKEKRIAGNNSLSSQHFSASSAVVYQSEKLLNLQIHFDQDINQENNYFGVLSLLVEKKTGRKLPSLKLFKDNELKNVLELAEIAFREKNKIEFGQSYNIKGFFFRNDKFELPEQIFLVKEGVLFVYNPYEISSYSNGNIAFQIPYKDIARYMAIR
jgi:hypothetical protein